MYFIICRYHTKQLFSPLCLCKGCLFFNHGSNSSAVTKLSRLTQDKGLPPCSNFCITYCLYHSLTLLRPALICYILAASFLSHHLLTKSVGLYSVSLQGIASEASNGNDHRRWVGEAGWAMTTASDDWTGCFSTQGSYFHTKMWTEWPLLTVFFKRSHKFRLCIYVLWILPI